MTNRRTTLETRFGHEATGCFPILAALYFVLSGTLGFAQEERARGGNGRGSGRGHFARPAYLLQPPPVDRIAAPSYPRSSPEGRAARLRRVLVERRVHHANEEIEMA